MADLVISPLVDVVMGTLVPMLIKKAQTMYRVGDELDALSKTLLGIRGLLADAQSKQIAESSVKNWLRELKDVAYDADDVLDEIVYEALRQEAQGESNKLDKRKQVCSFFPSCSHSCFGLKQVAFKLEIANRIKDINVRIEKIHESKEKLSLRVIDYEKTACEHIDQRLATGTTSSLLTVPEFEISGRDEDKEEIKKLLLSNSNEKQVSMISIIGMGGLGKTTLAQLVYNDKQVEEHFQVRAWVCVSEDFDVSRLTKQIIESAGTTETIDSSLALDRMQRELQKILGGNLFLIVLDDVWNEKSSEWEKLQAPLNVGKEGSKIIVTTRSDKVSTAMNADHPYHLKVLGDEDCLSLFLRRAFPREYPDAINTELREVGKELVERRCQGLPLAAKVLGGLLSSKRDLNSWESILKSQLWSSMEDESEIMKALRVSYHHLPLLHIKQCFAFCSIFAKDHLFGKDILVQLWIAQGFIQPREGINLEEEIGREYFDVLLSRSFFQGEPIPGREDRIFYKMHDCIHDLAMSVSKNECFRFEHGKPTPSPVKGHRHLSFFPDKDTKTEDFHHIYNCKGLRTFILDLDYDEPGFDINQVILDLNMNLRCLRVLVLGRFPLGEMPDLISNLKHLRYLNLSRARIEQLPESMSSLYNLQTLNLYCCFALRQLPKEMRKLVNLRHLNLNGCYSLQSMPPDMGKLTCLQTLPIFIVGRVKACGIGELKGLTALKGAISIKKLQNVSNAKEAEEVNLKAKPCITSLQLEWDDDGEDAENMQQVLEALQPPKRIKTLSINGYKGENYPTWLQYVKLPNLEDLTIFMRYKNYNSIPPLVQFCMLKSLCIGISGVKCIGREFYGGEIKGFSSLEKLQIIGMPHLEEWCEGEEGAFSSLQSLIIRDCPKLTKMPNNFPTLKDLSLQACHQLECLPKCPSLAELELWGNNEILLRGVPHLTSLSTLRIYYFEELKSLPEDMLQPLVNLKDLTITGCEKLVSFLEEDNGLPPILRSLKIFDCPNIKSLPKGLRSLTSLRRLLIRYCPQLLSLPKEGLPTSLQDLEISGCPKLSERCRKGDGEDWVKISHILRICID